MMGASSPWGLLRYTLEVPGAFAGRRDGDALGSIALANNFTGILITEDEHVKLAAVVGDQPQDRQGPGPDDPAVAPAAGGSGDRVSCSRPALAGLGSAPA
jgi:hypothetical protein